MKLKQLIWIAVTILTLVSIYSVVTYQFNFDQYQSRRLLRDNENCIEIIKQEYPEYPYIELDDVYEIGSGEYSELVLEHDNLTSNYYRMFFAFKEDPQNYTEGYMLAGFIIEELELYVVSEGRYAQASAV